MVVKILYPLLLGKFYSIIGKIYHLRILVRVKEWADEGIFLNHLPLLNNDVYFNKILYTQFALVCMLSHVWLFVIPWTVAYLAPPSVEFSMQEYWNGLTFPSVVDLPDLGIKPSSVQFSSVTQSCSTFCDSMDWNQVSCIAGRHFTLWSTREALFS